MSSQTNELKFCKRYQNYLKSIECSGAEWILWTTLMDIFSPSVMRKWSNERTNYLHFRIKWFAITGETNKKIYLNLGWQSKWKIRIGDFYVTIWLGCILIRVDNNVLVKYSQKVDNVFCFFFISSDDPFSLHHWYNCSWKDWSCIVGFH